MGPLFIYMVNTQASTLTDRQLLKLGYDFERKKQRKSHRILKALETCNLHNKNTECCGCQLPLPEIMDQHPYV